MQRGVIQGKPVTQISKELSKRLDVSFNNSQRLVRTETMHYLNEGAKDRYKKAGIEKVKWCTAPDERTCPKCSGLNERIFDINDTPIIPAHPRCRCTYIPVIETDIVLEPKPEENTIDNVTNIKELNDKGTEILKEYGIKVVFENTNIDVAKEEFNQFLKLYKEYNIDEVYSIGSTSFSGTTDGKFTRIGNNTGGLIQVRNRKKYITPELYKKKIKVGWDNHNAIVDPKNANIYTITHEFGHGFGDSQQRKLSPEKKDFWKELNKINKEYKKSIANNTKDRISPYAETSIDEFLAEAFTEAKLSSNPSKFSIEVLKIIEKYFKK